MAIYAFCFTYMKYIKLYEKLLGFKATFPILFSKLLNKVEHF